VAFNSSTAAAGLPQSTLLFGDGDAGAGGLPVEAQGAGGGGMVEEDGEIFHGGGERRRCHVDAGEVALGTGVGSAPFAGFFADDQRPFLFIRKGEEGVTPGGNGLTANDDVGGGDEGGGLVGPRAPDFAIRNQSAINFAALGARAGVGDGDGFAAAEVASGSRGRARTRRLLLRGANADKNSQNYNACGDEYCEIFHFATPIRPSAV